MADWAFSPWFSAQRHARPEENLGMVTHFFKFSPSCFTLFYHLQHQFSPLFEPSQMTKNIQWLKWQLRVTHLWTQNVCWILTPSGPSESTGSNGSGATGQGWSCRRKTRAERHLLSTRVLFRGCHNYSTHNIWSICPSWSILPHWIGFLIFMT